MHVEEDKRARVFEYEGRRMVWTSCSAATGFNIHRQCTQQARTTLGKQKTIPPKHPTNILSKNLKARGCCCLSSAKRASFQPVKTLLTIDDGLQL